MAGMGASWTAPSIGDSVIIFDQNDEATITLPEFEIDADNPPGSNIYCGALPVCDSYVQENGSMKHNYRLEKVKNGNYFEIAEVY